MGKVRRSNGGKETGSYKSCQNLSDYGTQHPTSQL